MDNATRTLDCVLGVGNGKNAQSILATRTQQARNDAVTAQWLLKGDPFEYFLYRYRITFFGHKSVPKAIKEVQSTSDLTCFVVAWSIMRPPIILRFLLDYVGRCCLPEDRPGIEAGICISALV
jgi:hypothetical protein